MTTLIFLGAAIIMVPLVKKLGLSSVIGYIVGGIIIGPFVLKLTGKSGDVEDIMHTTEFGVVMLLFLVGLELEPRKFWAMRRKISGLGLSQVLVTVALLFGAFLLMGWDWKIALTIALCFSMSSTAIVMQTLQEKNLLKTSAGEASFSTLLFQDIAVIPILALLPFLSHYQVKEENEIKLLIQTLPEWAQAGAVIGGVVVLILLGRYVFVPFLRYVSKSDMAELFTATSLFLVIGVSELMIAVGLSPALGAFIAGVMLANSEFRNELEAQIDPFKGLLLAVFFVSVGATINFTIIQKDPVLIFGLVALVLAVKFAVLFAIGKFFRMDSFQNFVYAFALSQIGEFAFVLLSFSSKLYIINRELNAQMMAVTAITMCITPFLLILNEKIISSKMKDARSTEESEFDIRYGEISPKKIIIVGFGHFGSTVGRMLKANHINATVLDHDAERVKLLRSYGFKVFYGDATRVQTLRIAGIADAEVLLLCLDDIEDNKFIAQHVRENYPNVKIFVRAKNRVDAYAYLNSGIENVYRETLGTAVDMAIDVLGEAGVRKYAARRMGKRFITIDKASVRKLARAQISDTVSFTVRDAFQREEELLAYDNLTHNEEAWQDDEKMEDTD